MASKAVLDFVHEAQLGNKGLVVSNHDDNGIVGHLMIGKASLVWFEKNKKTKGQKVSWDELRTWMMQKNEVSATRPT